MEQYIRHYGNHIVRAIMVEGRIMTDLYVVGSALGMKEHRRRINILAINEGYKIEIFEGNVYGDSKYIVALSMYAEHDIATDFLNWYIDNIISIVVSGDRSLSKHKVDTEFAITQIAKMYDLSGVRLNEILEENKVQYKVNGRWLLHNDYVGKGYVMYKRVERNEKEFYHMYWTPTGLRFVKSLLSKLGYKESATYEQEQLKLF